MNPNEALYTKQVRFFKTIPAKRASQAKLRSYLSQRNIDQSQMHQIIRQTLKDYQYYSNYRRQQLNLSEGQRVLKMNGIKISKQQNSFTIQKYVSQEQPLRKPALQLHERPNQLIKVQYCKSITLTDPRYMLSYLGYTTKEKDYLVYDGLEGYKCPQYGLEIVFYRPLQNQSQEERYVMIEGIWNVALQNPVMDSLVSKLKDFIALEPTINIDPYTLRPKSLRHGISQQF